MNAAEGFLSWVLFSFPGDESVGESEARMIRWERTAPALVFRDGLNRSRRLGYPLAAFIPTSSIQLVRTDHVPGPPTRRRKRGGAGREAAEPPNHWSDRGRGVTSGRAECPGHSDGVGPAGLV